MPHSLNPVECRLLACLIEKKLATPEYYPLTLKALQAACNQKTNRDPVMELEENEVQAALDSLRARQLVSAQSGEGQRSLKFHERLSARHSLPDTALALLCELLLRGEQTPGELRSRCARMVDREELEGLQEELERLAETGMVRHLERRAGQSERRWMHLLGPAKEPDELKQESVDQQEDPLVDLKQEVGELRRQVEQLRAEFAAFRRQFD